MSITKLRHLFIRAFQHFIDDNAVRLAAAFSFYAILALAPLLVMAVAIASNFLDEGSLRQTILNEARSALGQGAAEFISTLIQKANQPGAGTVATILSVLVALYGASNLFGQLVESLNSIWGIQAKGSAIKNFVKGKLFSVVMVFVFITLVLAWLVMDSVIGWMARRTGGFSGWPSVSILVTVAFLTLVFALTFRALPRGHVAWRDVWIPAFATAIGFALGKYGLSLYFAYSGVSAAYGSAGAVVVILLWFYYSSQIFFFGAELTYTYAHEYGSQSDCPPPADKVFS